MPTLHDEIRKYMPAIVLDRMLLRHTRRRIATFLIFLIVLGVLGIAGFIIRDSVVAGTFDVQSVWGTAQYLTATLILLSVLFVIHVQITFFYNTLYFRGVDDVIREDFSDAEGITLEVAEICVGSDGDLTRGFLVSFYGRVVMIRLGIPEDAWMKYLSTERPRIDPYALPLKRNEFLTPHDVSVYLYEQDETLRTFLFEQGITEELFMGACAWMLRVFMLEKYTAHWWSKDNLGKINGIGREFSYGIAYELGQYAHDIGTVSHMSMIGDVRYVRDTILKVETILTRTKSANVLLVGEPGVGHMQILSELNKRMRDGHSVASLSAKQLVVFNTDVFIATHNSKEEFEYAFLNLMAHTERAGNIIIIIDNFDSFLTSVAVLGVDATALLQQFLTSSNVQIVGTTDSGSYHQSLERNGQLLQYFEPVHIETPDLGNVVQVLEESVAAEEHRHSVIITYPALVRIAESAERYIVDGVMPDKALNLLSEVASRAAQKEQRMVETNFVDACVQKKTGIPTGSILSEEREVLLNLEDILHTRVVGQHAAIDAIAGAMRRARAGIRGSERPMSSFLFAGLTGVGKTETAKALASTLFGAEDKMVRFDMSEFSDGAGLARLIGTPQDAGVLSSALREHPYCVLLLDEFEKASSDVHDLFLQILDEGIFTDARGMRVNARNTIIVATSNAGSDLIWDMVNAGTYAHDAADRIIATIIERHIFKPELINRFDAVVVFEPLGLDEQREIARLMLEELVVRIKDRGYTLILNDLLLDTVTKEGYSPQFGARPMRRAIQDTIESRIARKIIAGGLKRGDVIEFTQSDLA